MSDEEPDYSNFKNEMMKFLDDESERIMKYATDGSDQSEVLEKFNQAKEELIAMKPKRRKPEPKPEPEPKQKQKQKQTLSEPTLDNLGETTTPEPKRAKLRVKKPRTEAQIKALQKGREKLRENQQRKKQIKATEKKQINRKKLIEKYDMDEYINEKVEEKINKRTKTKQATPPPDTPKTPPKTPPPKDKEKHIKHLEKKVNEKVEKSFSPPPVVDKKAEFFKSFFPK